MDHPPELVDRIAKALIVEYGGMGNWSGACHIAVIMLDSISDSILYKSEMIRQPNLNRHICPRPMHRWVTKWEDDD